MSIIDEDNKTDLSSQSPQYRTNPLPSSSDSKHWKKKYDWVKWAALIVLLSTISYFVTHLDTFMTKTQVVTYESAQGQCVEVYVNGKLNTSPCVVDKTQKVVSDALPTLGVISG